MEGKMNFPFLKTDLSIYVTSIYANDAEKKFTNEEEVTMQVKYRVGEQDMRVPYCHHYLSLFILYGCLIKTNEISI